MSVRNWVFVAALLQAHDLCAETARRGQVVLIRPAYDQLLMAHYLIYSKKDGSVSGLAPQEGSMERIRVEPESCPSGAVRLWDMSPPPKDYREDASRRFAVMNNGGVVQLRLLCVSAQPR